MKKLGLIGLFVLLAACVYAGPIVYGTYSTATWSDEASATYAIVTSTAAATSTTGSLLEIVSMDNGNTSVSRSITIWDSTGNTVFTKTYAIGQAIPPTPLPSQVAGPVSLGPLVVVHTGRSVTGHVYILSNFKALVLIKR